MERPRTVRSFDEACYASPFNFNRTKTMPPKRKKRKVRKRQVIRLLRGPIRLAQRR
jgi:hypothetical protein